MVLTRKGIMGLVAMGMLIGLLSPMVRAEQSPETQKLIAAHYQAAADAQKRVAFHEEMEKAFVTGRGGSKMDMVGHCKFWADYYRKLATQEEQTAKELEQKAL